MRLSCPFINLAYKSYSVMSQVIAMHQNTLSCNCTEKERIKCLKSFSRSLDYSKYDPISPAHRVYVKFILVNLEWFKNIARCDLCRNRKMLFSRDVIPHPIFHRDVLAHVRTSRSHESSLFTYNLSRASHLSFLWEKISCITLR